MSSQEVSHVALPLSQARRALVLASMELWRGLELDDDQAIDSLVNALHRFDQAATAYASGRHTRFSWALAGAFKAGDRVREAPHRVPPGRYPWHGKVTSITEDGDVIVSLMWGRTMSVPEHDIVKEDLSDRRRGHRAGR